MYANLQLICSKIFFFKCMEKTWGKRSVVGFTFKWNKVQLMPKRQLAFALALAVVVLNKMIELYDLKEIIFFF